MLRKIFLASVGAVALAGSAFAADLPSRPPPVYLPPVPIFTWTGLYVGGQIGYAWTNHNVHFFDPFGAFGDLHSTASGVIGGAHAGYNWQLSQFVLGVEADVDGSSLHKTINTSLFNPALGAGAFGATVTVRQDVQGSVRGRVGIAFDRLLVYGTGGVAFGRFDSTFSTNGFNPIFGTFGGSDTLTTTRVGWTAGGGVEYAITNNWSVRAEYRYTDLGRTTFYPLNSFAFAPGAFVNRRLTENRVQAGFSYKFDMFHPAPVVAKY